MNDQAERSKERGDDGRAPIRQAGSQPGYMYERDEMSRGGVVGWRGDGRGGRSPRWSGSGAGLVPGWFRVVPRCRLGQVPGRQCRSLIDMQRKKGPGDARQRTAMKQQPPHSKRIVGRSVGRSVVGRLCRRILYSNLPSGVRR